MSYRDSWQRTSPCEGGSDNFSGSLGGGPQCVTDRLHTGSNIDWQESLRPCVTAFFNEQRPDDEWPAWTYLLVLVKSSYHAPRQMP